MWQILKDDGIDPSPDRAATSWAAVLCGQAEAILACDFIETVTLTGQRQYILAVIEQATRRIRIVGTTAHPAASWVAQAARSLAMGLEDAGTSIRYLIRDRDGKFCALFDEVLAEASIQVVLTGVRMPRMNAVMERRLTRADEMIGTHNVSKTLRCHQARSLLTLNFKLGLRTVRGRPLRGPDRLRALHWRSLPWRRWFCGAQKREAFCRASRRGRRHSGC